uniref:Uncharacterized protein n=1 Tax=Anguilla anguilla TaxID=7936 RepID=A0A0E9VQN2_ANGAN
MRAEQLFPRQFSYSQNIPFLSKNIDNFALKSKS